MAVGGADGLLWISPGDGDPDRASRQVRKALGEAMPVAAKLLEVRTTASVVGYRLDAEADAAVRVADARGWDRVHLYGFSGGATAAIVAALRRPDRVSTLTLVEPATIGNDPWHPTEVEYWRRLDAIQLLPDPSRQEAFRVMLLASGEPLPPLGPPPAWTERDFVLQAALREPGFVSADLASIQQPTLVITGGRSHPRFALVARRLTEVLPNVEQVTFPDRSHLSSPHANEPTKVAQLLRQLWASA
jgi:pimeloyl-ACP methyl ester carboxylesterase